MSPSSSVPPGQQKKLKDFLKAKGHAAGKVNALRWISSRHSRTRCWLFTEYRLKSIGPQEGCSE